MTFPTKNLSAVAIGNALQAALSIREAAQALGVDPGTLRRKAEKEPLLMVLWASCAKRGRHGKSSIVRAARKRQLTQS